jgi:hypothetical protein
MIDSPIIDAEAKDQSYIVTIKILMPGNSSATSHSITVKAGDQIEAMAKAYAVWDDGTNRAVFLGTDIKKVK